MSRDFESELSGRVREVEVIRSRRRRSDTSRDGSSFVARVKSDARSWRPSVFLGSSGEALPVARALKRGLQGRRRVVLWKDDGVFRPSRQTLTTLIQRSQRSDFAILVGGADDVVTKRKKQASAIRDNVIFEFGLFAGALGLERSYLLVPRDVPLPSDFDGMTSVKYERRHTAKAVRDVSAEMTRTEEDLRRLIVGGARTFTQSPEFSAVRRTKVLAGSVVAVFNRIFSQLDRKGMTVAGFAALKNRCIQEIAGLERRHQRDIDFLGLRSEVRELASIGRSAIQAAPEPRDMDDPLLVALLSPAKQRNGRLRALERIVSNGAVGNPGWREGALSSARSGERFVRRYLEWLREFYVPVLTALGNLAEGVERAMTSHAAAHPERVAFSLGLSLWLQHDRLKSGQRFNFTAALRPRPIQLPSEE
jgi:hypothetical protein